MLGEEVFMSSVYQKASKVGSCVNLNILKLQDRYLSQGRDAAKGRATLARLKRLGMDGYSQWIAVGGELFSNLPDFALDPWEEKHVLNAVIGSFRLYARHQQSESSPMALRKDDSSPEARRTRSFGWSCWKAGCEARNHNREIASGITRRLSALESTLDFDGIEFQLRGLISIIKNEQVPIDYFLLAQDLYLLQIPGYRDGVFQRWSRDYFASFNKQKSFDEISYNDVK